MHKGAVIHSVEWGVYLGSAMGLGFWSKLDSVGQEEACTFKSKEEAQKHIDTWDSKPPSDTTFIEIETKDEFYASMKECSVVGIEHWSEHNTESVMH